MKTFWKSGAKKLFSVLLVFSLMLSAFGATVFAGEIDHSVHLNVTLDKMSYAPGDEVQVSISLANAAYLAPNGLKSLSTIVTFDPKVLSTDGYVTNGKFNGDGYHVGLTLSMAPTDYFSFNAPQDVTDNGIGKVAIHVEALKALTMPIFAIPTSQDYELVTFKLKVREGVEGGTPINIEVDLDNTMIQKYDNSIVDDRDIWPGLGAASVTNGSGSSGGGSGSDTNVHIKVTLDKESYAPGDEVKVSVWLSNIKAVDPEGLTDFFTGIRYDPAILSADDYIMSNGKFKEKTYEIGEAFTDPTEFEFGIPWEFPGSNDSMAVAIDVGSVEVGHMQYSKLINSSTDLKLGSFYLKVREGIASETAFHLEANMENTSIEGYNSGNPRMVSEEKITIDSASATVGDGGPGGGSGTQPTVVGMVLSKSTANLYIGDKLEYPSVYEKLSDGTTGKTIENVYWGTQNDISSVFDSRDDEDGLFAIGAGIIDFYAVDQKHDSYPPQHFIVTVSGDGGPGGGSGSGDTNLHLRATLDKKIYAPGDEVKVSLWLENAQAVDSKGFSDLATTVVYDPGVLSADAFIDENGFFSNAAYEKGAEFSNPIVFHFETPKDASDASLGKVKLQIGTLTDLNPIPLSYNYKLVTFKLKVQEGVPAGTSINIGPDLSGTSILKWNKGDPIELSHAYISTYSVSAAVTGGGGDGGSGEGPENELTELVLSSSSITLTQGNNNALTVTAKYSNGTEENVTDKATYTSNAAEIVTVSDTGVLHGVKTGTAQVTVAYGGQSKVVAVNVKAAATGGGSAPSGNTGGNSETTGTPTTPSTPTEPDTSAAATVFDVGAVKTADVVNQVKAMVEAAKKAEPKADPLDSNGHWAQSTIHTFVQLGVVEGYEDGSIRPDSDITRAEFVTILAKLFKVQGTKTIAFHDIGTHWAKSQIEQFAAAGVISGYGAGEFKPDRIISREEMAMIISRLVNLQKVAQGTAAGNFTDIQQSYAADAIKQAAQAGVVKGVGENKYSPKAPATRAEALTVILNTLKLNPEIKALLESI